MFSYPTKVRRMTSGFRPADRTNHNGVDFANPGTHEIYAAGDGTVTRSYRSTSYGECIFILHNINGQVYETVYAHMREGSRRVSVGQNVKRGQVIGIMGSTGDSTGQHLHFELHKGRWNMQKSNAVNPLPYLEDVQAAPPSPPKLHSSYTGNSIVDFLKSVGINSSFPNRCKLAGQYGVYGYNGTAGQNLELLKRMRA